MSNYNLTKEEVKWLMETYAPEHQSNMTITGQPDHEVSMASRELEVTAKLAQSMAAKMEQAGEANLPAWVQSKITKAADYVTKIYYYLEKYLDSDESMMAESAEGEIKKASHDIEVDITISDADMKKIHDGETVTLKDKAGSNTFVVHLKA